jgi:hypothetical protein
MAGIVRSYAALNGMTLAALGTQNRPMPPSSVCASPRRRCASGRLERVALCPRRRDMSDPCQVRYVDGLE